jgi:hypothetical protein
VLAFLAGRALCQRGHITTHFHQEKNHSADVIRNSRWDLESAAALQRRGSTPHLVSHSLVVDQVPVEAGFCSVENSLVGRMRTGKVLAKKAAPKLCSRTAICYYMTVLLETTHSAPPFPLTSHLSHGPSRHELCGWQGNPRFAPRWSPGNDDRAQVPAG